MKLLIALLALTTTACGILPPPNEHNLSRRYYSDMNNSKHANTNQILDTTFGVTTVEPAQNPPVIDSGDSCKRSHKGKCKNDNFKNGHYKPNKEKRNKHGSDRKNKKR
jgi:hypothetical protein